MVFLDAGEYVVVLLAQGLEASSGRTLDSPVVSVYKMRHGKVIESQMFYSDTAAIVILGQTTWQMGRKRATAFLSHLSVNLSSDSKCH